MRSDWIDTTLGDFAPFNYGKALPERDRVPGDVPVISSAGVTGVHAEAFVQSAGIVIGRKGTVGRITLCMTPFWPIDTAFYIHDEPQKRDIRFTYYLLQTLGLDQMNSDSAVPGLNRDNAHALPISIPATVKEQSQISNILSTLDEKIDLNRRINQTLEAMAQAIFKSWFVDFDPVKAKIAAIEQGQDPLRAAMRAISGKTDAELDQMPREHHDQLAATAALFPDAMQDSELGEIPKGWAVGTLADLCHLNPESWSARTLPDIVRYVDLANAKGGEISEVKSIGGKDIPSRARRILRYGDTIVGTVRPGNRSFALIGEDGLTGSTGFAVLRPKSAHWLEFVHLVATSEANIERLAHLADGGAYPAVRPEIVIQEDVVIPAESIVQAFSQNVKPLFAKIQKNRKSAISLAELRDTLLPKLLSGELLVADLDKGALVP
ncbi:hypothetical protein AAV94_03085 [Lampropedia cohaerens]|uniref:Type I restriction modification DNA specificity domain-containing protein n=1 Tax=Lampropedia cohaerens TaxID=1610491 RepID=A0A0U1Q1Y2_9BURK|nr:restriction endonuclease subunit S [Lampropedia cohaerens]KKW68756.1 hypothetical protein AAV94_03085 [Lampropedia cohaerens]